MIEEQKAFLKEDQVSIFRSVLAQSWREASSDSSLPKSTSDFNSKGKVS